MLTVPIPAGYLNPADVAGIDAAGIIIGLLTAGMVMFVWQFVLLMKLTHKVNEVHRVLLRVEVEP